MTLKIEFFKRNSLSLFFLGNNIFYSHSIYAFPCLCSKLGVRRKKLDSWVLFVFRSCARFISFHLFIRTREPVGYKIDLDSVNDDSE